MAFKLSTITAVERNLAITQVRRAISKHQGWIVDHTFLSNMAATLIFEMPSNQFSTFVQELNDLDICVTYDGDVPVSIGEDTRAIMSLTFIHNEPDMKRDIPHFG